MFYKPFFTIIVPIFNVETYLEMALNSILNQDFNNYEVIMIDDKSTDNSYKIAKKYSQLYSNFHLYQNQKNQGLSFTRNFGINLAKGSFLIFLDSDDALYNNVLVNLAAILDKNKFVEVVSCNLDRIYNDKVIHLHNKPFKKVINGDNFLSFQIRNRSFFVSSCRYVYNKDFIKSNNFLFKEGIFHEDEIWTPYILSKANLILCFNDPFYKNFFRKGSITNNTKNISKRFEDTIFIVNFLLSYKFPNLKKTTRILVLNKSISLLFHNFFLFRKFQKSFPSILSLKEFNIRLTFTNLFYFQIIKRFPSLFYQLYTLRVNYFNKNAILNFLKLK